MQKNTIDRLKLSFLHLFLDYEQTGPYNLLVFLMH